MTRTTRPVTRRYIEFDSNSRALMDAVTESVCILDHEGAILAANDEAADLFGFASRDDITGLSVWELLPDGAREVRQSHMDKVVDTGRPVRFEDVVEGRHFRHSIFPIFGYRGAVVRLAVFTSDMTDLIRSDEDLRREQQRHIFLMESLPGFAFLLDQDHAIRYANRSFRRIFGRYKKRRGLELLYGHITPAEAERPTEVFDTQRPLEFEWVLDDGAVYHVHCHPMADIDGTSLVLVLGLDVTDRKRAEQALLRLHGELEERVRQRTRELEKANADLHKEIAEHKRTEAKLQRARKKAEAATRAKSSFLANMSHEIRTPLNAVIGMTDLALRAEDDESRARFLQIVKEAGGSLLAVINDILDFSKVEARKLSLQRIPFDLLEALEKTLDVHSFQAGQKGLDLRLEIAKDVPRFLRGDPGRLRQVVHNLLANAIKFTPAGRVTVTVQPAELPGVPALADTGSDGRVRLMCCVIDTGIGIQPDKQRAVFRSFEQADGSITRQYGGTGLGLAISRHLVELMDGAMTMDSEPDRGSTFCFTAAFEPSDREEVLLAGADTVCGPVDLPPLDVLVVEDSALNRELVETFLSSRGHRVVTAENGRQALDALAGQAFDVVLMDVQMPLMDGVTAVRRIRKGRRKLAVSRNLPVIALTAHAMQEDRERFLAAGMTDYIAKPIDLDHLLVVMARVLDCGAAANRAGKKAASPKPAKSGKKAPAKKPRSRKRAAEKVPAAAPDAAADAGDAAEAGLPPRRDRAGAMRLMGDNETLMARMEAVYRRDTPGDLERLRAALEQADLAEVALEAHNIKGTSNTVGASRAGELAKRLEFAAREERAADLPGLAKALESEIGDLLEELEGTE